MWYSIRHRMRTVHVTQDVPANALDLSPDNTQVVIAGRHGEHVLLPHFLCARYWTFDFIVR